MSTTQQLEEKVIFNNKLAINGNHEIITLFNYYKESYEKIVRDPRQPLFITKKENQISGVDRTIMLVPEFLLMTGLDEDMRNSEIIKKEMITKTKMDPKSIKIL